MDFSTLKFSVTEALNLLSAPKSNQPATDRQMEKALNALSKDYLLGLTMTDVSDLLTVIKKRLEYSPTKPSETTKSFLYEYYTDKILGISRLYTFDEDSNRRYQVEGTKNEPEALRILSEMTGIVHEKNKRQFENEFLVGKPDVIANGSIIELKSIANYADFMKLLVAKPSKAAQYQLQMYMEITGEKQGDIVCVATGLSAERRVEYLEYAKNWYENLGYPKDRIDKRLQKIEMDCNLDRIPIEKRIMTFPYKKNQEMVKFIKARIRFARTFLEQIHSKYEKIVALPDTSPVEKK